MFGYPPLASRASRRAVLTASAASALTLTGSFGNSASGSATGDRTSSVEPGFGKAKRCIVLFMWGGPSQLDTFDLKPNAPAEVRGEFSPINSAVPGMQICEHFRHLAGLTDQVSLIRSLTHDDPAHLSSAHTTLTGHLPPVNKSDAEPPSRNDHPHLGAVLSQFHEAPRGLPSAVMMPWKTLHPAAPGGESPGQTGGWLGQSADPMLVTGDPNAPDWKVPALQLLDGIDTRRLDHRRELLQAIESQQRRSDSLAPQAMDAQQGQAFTLLGSSKVRQAFDLNAESDTTRNRYGRHIHGQCVLLGRRLLESGVPFVSVNWHNDGRNFWDTHGDNFNRLKRDLIPPADMALSALLTDLIDRNMLDETLVVWVGEFGRRPQINAAAAGREHHPFCYSGLLAGGGIRGGSVYGRSDEIAMHPEEDPVSPRDLVATMLHATGVPRSATLNDATGRPHPLYAGEPIRELFAS
ncbi:MAG: DUF1501 domain-containing protein [Planctomycetaceae bacterium]|nr:DUF1501 domain-containing protein [Planctomycetaceae bacterium]